MFLWLNAVAGAGSGALGQILIRGSVSWIITVRDVGAAQQYQERSFRSAPAPLASPLNFTAVTLSRVIAALEQMDAAPRRRATSP